MKKVISCLLVCVMAFALLAGCSGGSNDHEHTTGNWHVDAKTHWKECVECGKKSDKGDHEIVAGVCSVCKSEFTDFEDGSVFIDTFNEQGEHNGMLTFDPKGEIKLNMITEFEYDENGNHKSAKTYIDGRLAEEVIYHPVTAPDAIPALHLSISHYEDGSTAEYEYNEYGDMVSSIYYEADGTVSNNESYEYSYDENGNSLDTKLYNDGTLVHQGLYEYNGDEVYLAKEIYFDSDGSIISETEYDKDGNVK